MKKIILFLILVALISGCVEEIEKPIEGAKQIPNPASVYCQEQGGTLRIEENEAGQYGLCTLPDGTECEEWAYFRGECPEESKKESTETKETTTKGTVESDEDPSLIAHWKFNDNAEDSVNDNDGTIKGSAAFKAGKFGKAIYFDGIDDYVDFPKNTVKEVGSLSQGTIAFWFNFQSMLNKQTVMPIFYIGVNQPPNPKGFGMER